MGRPTQRSVASVFCTVIMVAAGAAGAVTFSDMTEAAGVGFNGEQDFHGTGAAFVDYDGDGDLDIYAVNGDGEPNHLFRNDGNLTFVDVAVAAGVAFEDDGIGVVFGDYDNDGDPDLFVTRFEEPNGLYRNDGGVFTDVTAAAGVGFNGSSTGANWGDLDLDGDLDLYVVNYRAEFNLAYRNNGDGTFTELGAQAGVDDEWFGFQAVLFDYDNDNDLDIYIANDKGTGNTLFRNEGNWQFTNVSVETGAYIEMEGMGNTVGDVNNDGWFDVYITNSLTGHKLLRNLGDGTFEEVSAEMNVEIGQLGWGTEFLDCDLDGDHDLFVVHQSHSWKQPEMAENVLLENPGGDQPFIDMRVEAGVDYRQQSFGIAVGDLDLDGDFDVYVTNTRDPGEEEPQTAQLLINEGTQNHWLAVDTEGLWSNRDGIGARVTVTAGGTSQLRQIYAGTGYMGQSEKVARFGLGSETVATQVEVLWPSGIHDVLHDVPADQVLTVFEGMASSVGASQPGALWGATTRPNPARGAVTIRLRSGVGTEPVRLSVYDARGRVVRRLLNGVRPTGTSISWDGTDESGRLLAPGVYLYKLEESGRTNRGKVVIAR